ncbi:hypothetical protein MPTK1_5g18150 [Marchantia polymorpha subsp. ruderalis]|uniref:Uncharacterized protein n=2 Tax=Marchantia polymorpha TaxID=3197 RepID=A0AAF6BJL4_MARPO|nr:hypothetical protein MARPO_0084s0062 [Marchantia polymorpha]PTQ33984.1 hypothetical protein MARPO_0084s0062 [Marchantia polymorpha]BBN12197.1 hypothetical protein Mp_5g18150 [Marchantia polymorpha subsp. ruderalis]BBN12198.1 hypothetical protein Mp_5g18150 [Marchantia polymorpha subsp. ruderalis]|eukprot:PTQ33983.1 hypothetical protein MARPO_0084s0062 [Marchantia polymorpha]
MLTTLEAFTKIFPAADSAAEASRAIESLHVTNRKMSSRDGSFHFTRKISNCSSHKGTQGTGEATFKTTRVCKDTRLGRI